MHVDDIAARIVHDMFDLKRLHGAAHLDSRREQHADQLRHTCRIVAIGTDRRNDPGIGPVRPSLYGSASYLLEVAEPDLAFGGGDPDRGHHAGFHVGDDVRERPAAARPRNRVVPGGHPRVESGNRHEIGCAQFDRAGQPRGRCLGEHAHAGMVVDIGARR